MELPTTIGVVLTTTPQRAPAPVRVAIPRTASDLDVDVWAKTTLVRTVPVEHLSARLGAVSPPVVDQVTAALGRIVGAATGGSQQTGADR